VPFFSAGQKLTATALQRVVPLAAYKAADEIVNNSTTFQNDDDLFLSLEANAVYLGELHLLYNTGSTPDLKYQFTKPASCTLADWSFIGYSTAGALVYGFGGEAISIGGTGAKLTADAWGLITTTSAGVLQLQWAQNTLNASDSTLMAGSYLLCQRLA
jgi:hypothetical protein